MGTRLSYPQLQLLDAISKGRKVTAKINRCEDRTVIGMGTARYRDGKRKVPVNHRTINILRHAGLVKWVDREHFRVLALKNNPEEWDELWEGDPEHGKISLGIYGGDDKRCRLGYWWRGFFCQYAQGTRRHCRIIGDILGSNAAKFYFPH